MGIEYKKEWLRGEGWGWGDREFEIDKYIPLYLKWMTNKELCSMLCGSLDGRGVWGRMDTCICMLSPFAVH